MNAPDPNDFTGQLSDYRFQRLAIACGPCGRHGSYRVKTLRTLLFNPPLAEVPRLMAIKAGCPLAMRFPGHECGAWFVTKGQPVAASKYLGDRRFEGWQLILTCERSHQGLTATKPCPRDFELDLSSLVAVLGHSFEIDQLNRRLQCPGCGSHHYGLAWIAPKPKPPAAEPIPLKRAG